MYWRAHKIATLTSIQHTVPYQPRDSDDNDVKVDYNVQRWADAAAAAAAAACSANLVLEKVSSSHQ